jgi:hypothetical protein
MPLTNPPYHFNELHTTTSSPYRPQPFRVIMEPQPNIFPIPLNNTHVKLSPLSTLITLIIAHDQTPQPTPILPTRL